MLADGVAVAEEHELIEQIDFIAAEIMDIPELFREPKFDLVVCHNVIHYLDDPDRSLRALHHPLRRGGLLSLVTINGFSEVYKAAFRELDLRKALDQLDASHGHGTIFDLAMRTFTEREIIDLVEQAGCTIEGFYGVRCLCDWLPNEPKFNEPFMSELEELEFSLADRYPYYLLARFFQVICSKDSN
jgi:S-adenosylmethionine-dependent methyltransferase